MDSTKKNIQKTSGTRKQWKFYKPGQLVTVDGHVYRITKASDRPSCKYCVNYKNGLINANTLVVGDTCLTVVISN